MTVWHPSTRLAFRFAFAYFGLYALTTHLLIYLFVFPGILPGQGAGTLWPMLYVGMVKVIPTQFPAPSLLTLVAPVGNLSLQGFLWTSIGASAPYQIFTGIVEVLGGLLLLAPRTTLLGAMICLASMAQVFV